MCGVFVIMGVSGSGKTTVGRALAREIGAPFYDGDDFHPAENVAKMAQGIALDDEDRYPWLIRLRDLIADHLARRERAVVACSALKKAYRELLRQGNDGVEMIYLQGSFGVIWQRMKRRQEHYMKADMLRSQFEALEPPTPQEALLVDAEQRVDAIVARIVRHFDLGDKRSRE